MNFTASNYNETIQSRSSFVPSDNQLEYSDGQTIRFEIPSFMGFIDPRQTYLKFKVKVNNAPAVCCFSKKSGIHSIINNLRIYDANTNLQLETIMSYGELAEKLHFFTENTSIRNRRGLTELLEYTSRSFDGGYYDNRPSRNANQSQLFNTYETGSNATYTSAVDITQDTNTCEVAMRLYSGILGEPSTKMFPAMLTSGLRMELDLNTAGKCLELWCADGICNDDGTTDASIGDGNSCRFGIMDTTDAVGDGTGALTSVDLYCEKNAGYNQITIPAGASVNIETSATSLVRNQLVGAVNLVKGQVLYGFKNTYTGTAPNDQPTKIGTITSIECNAGENTGGVVRVKVFITAEAGVIGSDFTGGAGNIEAGTVSTSQRTNSCWIRKTDMFGSTTPTITLNDVELVVKTASPPKSYVDGLMKSSQTTEGAMVDYMTYSVYRNNIQSGESVAQINIPALNNRATSIITLPTLNGGAERVDNNNFDTYVDNGDNYYFLVNGKSQPTRQVDLTPLSEPEQFSSQVSLWETEKALGSSKVNVLNLDHQADNFVIARALARYGGVYPLVKDGNISLKVSYNSPTLNKNMITYVGGIRRLIVSSEGSRVEM